MKTDSIFYCIFKDFPNIFFELINNLPETSNTYTFSSVEIKQTSFIFSPCCNCLPNSKQDFPYL
ncbi:DUF2887 domain-containing protein [Brunnivagina elsteri]|uniref:DUF2887 domain-containing protein n=1 Tax=Brunnivagina elsteri CCALA 953 TaxID=987040 RepID=A0A2A2TGN5_9CYAN|nr:hypothetical protein CK510_17365 [Calothrix elsteri CCALA 953]